MATSPRLAAIDQACLLAAYLHETPSSSLDLEFIQRHLDALSEFALAAKSEPAARTGASDYALPLRATRLAPGAIRESGDDLAPFVRRDLC